MSTKFSNNAQLYLGKHDGFIRVAANTNRQVVPIFVFGTNEVFQLLGTESQIAWLAKVSRIIRMSIFAAYGRWGLPIPRQVPLVIVIGAPIVVATTATTTPTANTTTTTTAAATATRGGSHDANMDQPGEKDLQNRHIHRVFQQYKQAINDLFNNYKGRVKGYEHKHLFIE